MSLLQYIFGNRQRNTASLAKERLQIIVSHERVGRNGPDYLPLLREELIRVISKYVDIDREQVKVQLERTGDYSVLELNVTLPDLATADSN
jgi:cell division topological specificity factor